MNFKRIKMLVYSGCFRNVARAAYAEKSVQWFVPDPAADAVTESFAAEELRNIP